MTSPLAASTAGTTPFTGRSTLTRTARSTSRKSFVPPRSGQIPPASATRCKCRPKMRPSKCVALVYGADKSTAVPGDIVIFTAWITNESQSHLRNIRLIQRSFTNEAMEPLVYSSGPDHHDLSVPSLAPGEGMMRSFSYRVTASDHDHGGSLISAMQVSAFCLGHEVSDEHDAIVALSGPQVDWLSSSTRPGLGYWSITTVTSVSPRRRPRPRPSSLSDT